MSAAPARVGLAAASAALLCIATVVAWRAPAAAARHDEPRLERRVKAAFLYKFTGYVEWPAAAFPRADSPVRIGVVGDDALATNLAQLTAGRTNEGRTMTVLALDTLEPSEPVHILFVSRAATGRLRERRHADPPPPTLIVTEAEGALMLGGTINFVISQGRVRFEISLASAERAGIGLSSRLLAVAQAVVPRSP